jgi:hypothetical protein
MNPLVRIALSASCLVVAEPAAASPPLDGISFAVAEGKLYLPLDEAACGLNWTPRMTGKELELNGQPLDAAVLRQLPDGAVLVPLDELARVGATVTPGEDGRFEVVAGDRSVTVLHPPKRVEISLAAQRLRAWQGGRLVLESRISSGRRGSTPAGDFTAGPYKARMHYSNRYHNAPMPWSVQIHGHVFIHGFASVPDHPASHGCIRLPLDEGNPARFFYEWIDPGTPVKVTRE